MNPNPQHIAIIMDGNGRWAQKRGKTRIQGHFQGREVAQKVILEAQRQNISYLSLFTFSAENWSRPKEEVSYIMKLCKDTLSDDGAFFHKHKIRFRPVGDLKTLSSSLQDMIRKITEETKNYKKLTVVLAISYGGRQEILRSFKRLKEKNINLENLTIEELEEHLDTQGMPHPDLVIRTGGVQRLSNFLIWQTAYSELFFSSKMWPEFTEADFCEAIAYYQKIERKYGKIHEASLPRV